jgi:predicted DNA-binding transcriptional regulator YafY
VPLIERQHALIEELDARRELPPLTLTPGEASALIASLVAVGPYISASAQSALGKLLAALAPEPK